MKNINITHHNVGDFIAKEIEGSASQLELLAIKEWIGESDENRRFYEEMIKVDEMYETELGSDIDTNRAWSEVKRKISADSKDTSRRRIGLRSLLGYAATIGILILAGVTLFQQDDGLSNLETTSTGLTHELADGSLVRLGSNSAMSQLHEEKRTYSLSGKAEFEVVHDDKNPFQVNIDDVRVKDLGTIFAINALPENDTVFVKVDEGLVQFFTITQNGIFLKQGEEGMYIKSKNKFYKRSIDISNPLLNISFQNSTLGEVLDHLAYSFRKQFTIENEEVRNCNITVDFSDATYSVVKEVIEETLNVKLSENDSGLVVSGSGCE